MTLKRHFPFSPSSPMGKKDLEGEGAKENGYYMALNVFYSGVFYQFVHFNDLIFLIFLKNLVVLNTHETIIY